MRTTATSPASPSCTCWPSSSPGWSAGWRSLARRQESRPTPALTRTGSERVPAWQAPCRQAGARQPAAGSVQQVQRVDGIVHEVHAVACLSAAGPVTPGVLDDLVLGEPHAHLVSGFLHVA